MVWPSSSSTSSLTPSRPPTPRWSCPLPGFRLMTSDSPLRGASCLQSAVRLLVIIFQSVTLVSASWRWERRGDGGPGWLDGWGGERGEGKGCDVWWWGVLCLCVHVCVDWSGCSGLRTQAVTALYCSPRGYIRLKIKDGSERKKRKCCTVFLLVFPPCLSLDTNTVALSSHLSCWIMLARFSITNQPTIYW